ncbi:GAF domain-containing protein [Persicimonas caeni]|uniref:histidine kinase n=1 Tax=Persicimonas caeni TaxID=2292766 RepID=A0A4Y6PUS9_PERCE|nr:GAF domain-containing protein [Persicimonas caeni]QDG51859.1 GAF domain-containing protein [Persicimonas caeni]QED33080.1 GAF domain-containing protein [Persicimonas caeni]
MNEDLVHSDLAPSTVRARANSTDSREALLAWLSRPKTSLEDTIRELSSEQLTRLLEEIGEVLRQQEAKFTCMQEIGSALGQTIQLDELLHLIMEKITRLMEAQRSTLFLVDDETGELWSKVAQGGVDTEIRLQAGQGLAGWVAMTGKSINVRDAYNDPRFNPDVDAQTGYKTRNMLCQPVRNQEGHIIGVVQVLNRNSGDFTIQDENLLSAIASQTAVAIENSKLYLSVVDKNIELRRTQKELEKKVNELDLLYEVERELSRALDLDDLIETITQKALDLISARASALTLREDDHNRMYVLVDRSPKISDRQWEFSTSVISCGRGIAGKVIESGDPFVCDMGNCGVVSEAASYEIGFEVHNVISVPLFDDDECIGALEVMNRFHDAPEDGDEPRSGFTEDDKKILTLIAGQIAAAVATRRHRQEQEKAERLATIGQMLTGVVHDLKNPIAVISGNVQLMAKADDREKRDEYAASIKKQFKHLNQMTRELLVFARGDTEITVDEVILSEFFAEVGELLRHELSDTDVEFRTRLDYEGKACFDSGKMKRTIVNLARNAAEAMTDGGVFEMSVDRNEETGELVFACRDTGPGIPEEIRTTLFDSFVTKGKKHGTGLGLAIVKKIVEEHGGEITFETEIGKGTTFYISLPQSD